MQEFLKKVSSTIESYEKKDTKNGVNFNLFSILDRETDEEKTHSAFIAALLNSQGSHGQGNKFLNLFVKILAQKKQTSTFWKDVTIPNLGEIDNLQIYTERNVGKYLERESRLDIVLLNKNWQIIIENKFNAKQGENQLERYLSYLKEDNSRKTLLIYLTKNGEKYKSNTLKEGTDYFCLTYRNDILNWISNCIKTCTSTPTLMHSFSQYFNLIQKETNQDTNEKMKNEIQELILQYGIKETSHIVKNYEIALKSIVSNMQESIVTELNKLENVKARKQDDPFYSIFLNIKGRTIGIESFNIEKNTHRKNTLFIGELDFDKKNDPKDLVHTFWMKKTIETIWDEKTKLSRINEYGKDKEKREEIIQEIVDYTRDFIKRII